MNRFEKCVFVLRTEWMVLGNCANRTSNSIWEKL